LEWGFQSLSFAPLPNPLLKGEGKGITFNTGEVYQRGQFIHSKLLKHPLKLRIKK
jgi:hypothetical protein